ncbi:type I glutamate--ammonia ligase [Pseudofrancisella aestuarii]|uniref:Glutamine synthetase n=1 Tax=Pseudofrancisella aestuarii TaxID=2670347 RepID=A0ABV9TEC9_9GAMM|nr:type I glutamate--ammonia ligase [Pseudofrancisella aestuarii]
MNTRELESFIKEEEVRFVDLRFTDIKGKEHHVTVPASCVDEDFFKDGKMFDGSSIAGWKTINESDMILKPDLASYYIDPFYNDKTIVLSCDVYDPKTLDRYERDPRSISRNAEDFLKTSGIATDAYFGPEPEFFIFDDVTFKSDMEGSEYRIRANHAAWDSNKMTEFGNKGHRPGVKGGYFPVAPVDHLHNIRAEMCKVLEDVGQEVEVHHHEVATGGQSEIGMKFNSLTKKSDEVQQFKYIVHNVANEFGKTATFMPKPIPFDNGSGMHIHLSLFKDGKNLFTGDDYAGLSETALFAIGGIIKHARALNAFTNPSTNSYKRLVPGYEAPVLLAYSARNRSASIRIPYIANPKARRIEIRFSDPMANPYLAFSAVMLAALDGIKNKIHPGAPMDQNLYELPKDELAKIPTVAPSLRIALQSLDADREFLKQGGVFTDEFIDAFIELKLEELTKIELVPHPMEFQTYYSL